MYNKQKTPFVYGHLSQHQMFPWGTKCFYEYLKFIEDAIEDVQKFVTLNLLSLVLPPVSEARSHALTHTFFQEFKLPGLDNIIRIWVGAQLQSWKCLTEAQTGLRTLNQRTYCGESTSTTSCGRKTLTVAVRTTSLCSKAIKSFFAFSFVSQNSNLQRAYRQPSYSFLPPLHSVIAPHRIHKMLIRQWRAQFFPPQHSLNFKKGWS